MAFDSTGDNGAPAPIGADPVEVTSSSAATPTPVDLTDDSLIRVAGIDKPVKYGEHVKGFQSQFTKATQRAAALERELAQERAQRQRFEQERQRQTSQPQGAPPDVFADLRQLPYVNGEQAVQMAEGITQQIQQRDKVLIAALTKMQQMEKILNGLHQSSSTSAFDGKISKWVTDLGYGPEAVEVAKEIYLAYEGEDLDASFPQILADRMKQLEALFDARKRQALERARRQPFVPGRGGQTGPSSPLQLKGNESPKQLAEMLWNNEHGT